MRKSPISCLKDELNKIHRFCAKIGMDYGEVDVLRDRDDGRIYIVDANNTPSGPPSPISDSDGNIAVREAISSIRRNIWGLKNMLNSLISRILSGKIEQKILQMCPSVITHVETRDPVAALTFDDGPHPVFTPRVLSILKKHDAKATFFMVGVAATRYPRS